MSWGICDEVESPFVEERKKEKKQCWEESESLSRTSAVARRCWEKAGVQGTAGKLAVMQLEQQFQGFLVYSHHIEKRTALVFYVYFHILPCFFLVSFVVSRCMKMQLFFLQHSCLQTWIFPFLSFFFQADWKAVAD